MSDRFYYNEKTGQYLPSGTTVLPKPFLAQWASDCAVNYIEQEVRDNNGDYFLCDPLPARTAYKQESMEAADYGTYIHKLCEVSLTDNIRIESPHELTDGFMDGLWKWKEKHNVKVIAMEHTVITETYGGRLDLVCEMDSFWMTKAWCKKFGVEWYDGIRKQRVIVLVDFKTGKSSYYETWKYQTAGYRQAYNKEIAEMAEGFALETNSMKEIDGEFTDSALPIFKQYISDNGIAHHGVLKFNKDTGKVNYKDFTVYEATRTNPKTKEKEKYIRDYEMDRQTFNSLVSNWWLQKRGIKI